MTNPKGTRKQPKRGKAKSKPLAMDDFIEEASTASTGALPVPDVLKTGRSKTSPFSSTTATSLQKSLDDALTPKESNSKVAVKPKLDKDDCASMNTNEDDESQSSKNYVTPSTSYEDGKKAAADEKRAAADGKKMTSTADTNDGKKLAATANTNHQTERLEKKRSMSSKYAPLNKNDKDRLPKYKNMRGLEGNTRSATLTKMINGKKIKIGPKMAPTNTNLSSTWGSTFFPSQKIELKEKVMETKTAVKHCYNHWYLISFPFVSHRKKVQMVSIRQLGLLTKMSGMTAVQALYQIFQRKLVRLITQSVTVEAVHVWVLQDRHRQVQVRKSRPTRVAIAMTGRPKRILQLYAMMKILIHS